ncbi:hypothetical protein C0992_012041 [Termitomyces sp. T32_za158]|nr:hypothetical protein C0992_012041 [Termitomyces sp. T32_za158]
MPVTFAISGYKSEYVLNRPRSSPEGIPCHKGKPPGPDMYQEVLMTKNGFVRAVLAAHALHHNLVIRPDDVWIAIISQFSFYLNAHAEELSDKFTKNKGRSKRLVIKVPPRMQKTTDFENMAIRIIRQIEPNVKDKTLIPWVIPTFSTTTDHDKVICSALIVSTTKQESKNISVDAGGIPYLTLEGTRADWYSIWERVVRLREFGPENQQWSVLLGIILRRFVRAFEPDWPQRDQGFWESIVHERADSPATPYLSGWIAAFYAWDNKGNFLQKGPTPAHQEPNWLAFDGVWFPRIYTAPEEFAEVKVTLVDPSYPHTPKKYFCTMLAGHVGFYLDGRSVQDLIPVRMVPHWLMYFKGDWEDLNEFRGRGS